MNTKVEDDEKMAQMSKDREKRELKIEGCSRRGGSYRWTDKCIAVS